MNTQFTDAARQREALRQQMLLRVLWRDAQPAGLQGWVLQRHPGRMQRGLDAYRANAGASAERALAVAFPTLQQLVGDSSFAGLARAYWHAHAPEQGDLALLGGHLADFIAASSQLADVPYLADCARLDWAVHEAERAADVLMPPKGLEHLATHDPQHLFVELAPGTSLLVSSHPIVSIWRAHRCGGTDDDAAAKTDRFASVRAAFAAGLGEQALVAREGWRASVAALDASTARFTHALLARQSLGAAIDAAGTPFDFETWLLQALRQRQINGVTVSLPPRPTWQESRRSFL